MFFRGKSAKNSYLYDLRYVLMGYAIGKLISTRISLCRVVGDSMHPTLQHSTSDVVLLWHDSAAVDWLEKLTRNLFGADKGCAGETQKRTKIHRGSIYVVWHPSREYKVIKRAIGIERDTVRLPSTFTDQHVSTTCWGATETLASRQTREGDVRESMDPLRADVGEAMLRSSTLHGRSLIHTIQPRHDSSSIDPMTVVDVPPGYAWMEGDNASISEDSRSYGVIPQSSITAKAVGIVWPPSRVTFLPSRDVSKRVVSNL